MVFALYCILSIEKGDLASSKNRVADLRFLYNAHILYIIISGFANSRRIPLEASFSPDSQFVFSGSSDGCVHAWNADTGSKLAMLRAEHTGPVGCVQFNPKYMMLASACNNMAFWLPTLEETT